MNLSLLLLLSLLPLLPLLTSTFHFSPLTTLLPPLLSTPSDDELPSTTPLPPRRGTANRPSTANRPGHFTPRPRSDKPYIPPSQRRAPPGDGRPTSPAPRAKPPRDKPRGDPRDRGSFQDRGPGIGRQEPTLTLNEPYKVRRIRITKPPSDRSPRDPSQSRGPPGDRPSQGPPSTRGPRPGGARPGGARPGGGFEPAAAGAPTAIKPRGLAPKKPSSEWNKKKQPLRLTTNNKSRRPTRRGSLKRRDRSSEKERREEMRLERSSVALPASNIGVGVLADLMEEKVGGVVKFLMTDLGVLASATMSIDRETATKVVEGFGRMVKGNVYDYDDYDSDDEEEESVFDTGIALEEDDSHLAVRRPPVITVMGHVDHGKTSLLDALRSTDVRSGEAGGITQHVGAYQIDTGEEGIGKLTCIDTPGHAAFSDMRSRGANITDIVVLCVAADDGVMPQTADSIMCAKAAGVPVVVAVNKIDLETADANKVKGELTKHDLLVEELGGDVLCCEVSAKERIGLDNLLEKIRLQSELMDLKANPDRDAGGVVVEAKTEKGLGVVATVLVQKGTLRVGDNFVAGESSGKVRAIFDDANNRVLEAGPSMPVKVVGFAGVPLAGDLFVVADDLETARALSESRTRLAREDMAQTYQAGLMANVADLIENGLMGRKVRKEMTVIVKADVQGSAEALARAFKELTLEDDESEVVVNVLVAAAGEVTKTDVSIAAVREGTTIIAFNVAATVTAMEEARLSKRPIKYFDVIYDAIDEVQSRMQEVLSPTPEGEYAGSAEVLQVFNIGGTGNIAGSKCLDGRMKKGENVRVMRGDKIIVNTVVRTLRNLKSEVEMIEGGTECGVGLVGFEDFKVGDKIECYITDVKKKR